MTALPRPEVDLEVEAGRNGGEPQLNVSTKIGLNRKVKIYPTKIPMRTNGNNPSQYKLGFRECF